MVTLNCQQIRAKRLPQHNDLGTLNMRSIKGPWGSATLGEQRVTKVNNITQLRLKEHVQVDHDRLNAIYSEMDHVSAEDMVCRAMEELALRMAHCDRHYRAFEFEELRKSSRSLIAIADQIGMTVMARVARDVSECANLQDPVPLAATLARLMRTGEESLTAIWDIQYITI